MTEHGTLDEDAAYRRYVARWQHLRLLRKRAPRPALRGLPSPPSVETTPAPRRDPAPLRIAERYGAGRPRR